MDLGERAVVDALRDLGANDKWIYRSAVVARLRTAGFDLAAADSLLDRMIDAGTVRRHPMEWNAQSPRLRLP